MSDQLFHRTGGADFPDKLKVLVSGMPKSGKTTLLGTVPNIVIADTEPFANNLQSVAHLNLPYVTVRSTSDLRNLQMVLAQDSLRAQAAQSLGMQQIDAVAIDTLDTLQKIMKRERMVEQRTSKFLRDDWAWLKEELAAIITSFTSLPLHVFFMVHLKTKDIGSEDNPKTVVLPGLEGSIADDIAGMVGYSLLSFRKQEIRADGSPYTKYWLRAEGDETYEFLGNRAAGSLPDIIEPNFGEVYQAAMAAKQHAQKQASASQAIHTAATPATAVAPPATPAPAAAPVAPPVAPAPTIPAQQAQAPQAQAVAAPVQQAPVQQAAPEPQAPQPAPQPAAQPQHDGNEPVSAAGLAHLKRIYDACRLEFPEEKLKALTLADARDIARMWAAIQQDHIEGKSTEKSPESEMIGLLAANEWLTDLDQQRAESAGDVNTMAEPPDEAQETGPQVEPRRDGTIQEILAWVGDDLARVQEIYEAELARQKPRSTLVSALENKGAKPPVVQTDVQNPAPVAPVAQPSEGESATVTPEPQAADAPATEEQAVTTAKEVLGGSVLATEEDELSKPCDVCGKTPVDDLDIARLGKGRFNGQWLCVSDYIAETKKPKAS